MLTFAQRSVADPDRMFLGLLDPDPDPVVTYEVRIQIRILL
jgi:hypothetical protein